MNKLASLSLGLFCWWPLAALAQLSPGFGQAPAPSPQGPEPGWVRFTEPTESAFTVEVPQGWRVAGGLKRYAASEVPTWLTIQSPDGATEMFLGDPALGFFGLPSQFAPEGAQMPGVHGRAMAVMRYRPGAEFAAYYGGRNLPATCQDVRLQGTRPLPQLEDEMRQHVQDVTRLDAGEAVFTCQRNGQPFAAAVDAGTGEILFPGGNGMGAWGVGALRGYVTPAPNAGQAAQVLAHVAASFKLDPQFEAAVKQAGEQENRQAQQQQQLQQQQRAQIPAPVPQPGPVIISPYVSPRSVSRCDDLQQQRICAINNGHIVVSDGCMKCI